MSVRVVMGVVMRVSRAGAGSVLAAVRRMSASDTFLCLLTAAVGLLPLLLAHPRHPVLAVLAGLWTVLLVAVRRELPVPAVLGCAPVIVGGNVWTLAALPLIVLSATRRIAPTRRAWQVVGVACAVLGVLVLGHAMFRWEAQWDTSWDTSSESPWRTLSWGLASGVADAVLLLLLPALSGTLLGRRRPLADLLRERNVYLEQTRALTTEAARLEERARIAGEMHDLLGHRLSLISVHAGALELAAARQAPPLTGQAELLRTTAGTAMEELREILGVLRHTDQGESEPGTRADITALVTESRRTDGGPVELDWALPDTAEVGARTRQAIHRVVREGLTNVLKHASGAPTRVTVGGGADVGVEVTVVNGAPRGAGRSHGGTHSGLAGLQERVSLLGGTFAAGPLPDGGFRVAALLPSDANKALPTSSAAGAGAALPPPAEVLTWPRVLGAGCVAVLVVLPTAGFLVVLLVMAALR